jgi:hypothetical protein
MDADAVFRREGGDWKSETAGQTRPKRHCHRVKGIENKLEEFNEF